MVAKRQSNTSISTNKTFQEELKITLAKIKHYKLSCEANIVSVFWKNSDLLYDHDNLKLEDFNENVWRVFYEIAHQIVITEGKSSLDDITVGLYLEKHDKLREKFSEYGGMSAIQKTNEYIKE